MSIAAIDAVLRTKQFKAGCAITAVFNVVLNLLAAWMSLTDYFRVPLAASVSIWKSEEIGSSSFSLGFDILLTSLLVSFFTAYLGGAQPAKDAAAGLLPVLSPVVLTRGWWRHASCLRIRSPCARSSALTFALGLPWAVSEYALVALASAVLFQSSSLPSAAYLVLKAGSAALLALLVYRLAFVAALAHAPHPGARDAEEHRSLTPRPAGNEGERASYLQIGPTGPP